MQKVKGTRDFFGIELLQRNYVIELLKTIYEKYNFQQLETPAFEYVSLLKDVYGDENEKLLYKILNSGDFHQNIDFKKLNNQQIIENIAEKCLRYDLTLPLMRYVCENKNTIVFPFKRYQIQPVWRADKPQKGRFREFYQCDVDIVGSDSLLCEAELIHLAQNILEELKIKDYTVKLNHRGILADLAELLGVKHNFSNFCCLIDKIDKIGLEKFFEEVKVFNITNEKIQLLQNIFTINLKNEEYLQFLKNIFLSHKISIKNVEELESFLSKVNTLKISSKNIKIDFSLARGLNYYTGIIFEIYVNNVVVGSIVGGGRYNYFAEKLNIPELCSVGFSFGLDRLLVVLNELNLLNIQNQNINILFINQNGSFDFEVIDNLRRNYSVEIYFDKNVDFKKQLKYADKKNFKYVIFENSENFIIKNMLTGFQTECEKNNIEKFIFL